MDTTNMTMEQLVAELARVQAENEALKASKTRNISMKVSDKGALSVYGMGKFPVTLYVEQWQTLLGMKAEFESFIAANKSLLKTKADKLVADAMAKEAERKARVAEFEKRIASEASAELHSK